MVAFALVSCASAQIRPIALGYNRDFERDAVILKHEYDLNPVDNSYVYGWVYFKNKICFKLFINKFFFAISFETSNGIRADQQGYLKNPGTQLEAQVMQGSYSYTGPDGVVYTVTYIADENGYRASGAHIPVIINNFLSFFFFIKNILF